MKKLLTILLLISTVCHSQIFFMVDKSTTAPSGTLIRTEAEAFETWNSVLPAANTDIDASLYNVGTMTAGTSTMTYIVNPAASGSHSTNFRVASTAGATLLVKSGGTTIGTIIVPATGGGSIWTTVSGSPITFAASGSQTITIALSSGSDCDFNWFEIDNSLAPAINRTAWLNFTGFYGSSPAWVNGISQWMQINPTNSGETDIAAGTYTKSNLHTKRLLATTWGITLLSASNTAGSPTPGTDGAGVFANSVLDHSWHFAAGNAVKITGLNITKTYTIYILGNSQTYDGGTVSYSANTTVFYVNDGGTTSTIATSNNYGNSATYPNYLNDHSLMKASSVAPNGSGEITITGTLVSGTWIPINAMVIIEN